MTDSVKMELAAANRQLASSSPQDSPIPDKQTVSQRKEKRLKWRSTVEDKSSMFSSAWNELYNVLGEYKAVLLKRDEMEEHYDETSDVDRLRNELLEKDQVIFEKENEMQTVRDQAAEYRRKFEQSQLEVSVKESLLKKYQGEILQKEQLLLESRTKTTRLESKIRLLETQVSNSSVSEPPRKIVRVTQPATPVGAPVRVAPTTPVGGPVRAAPTPTRGGRQVATRGRSPMSTRRTQREPTPEVVESPPICLDDDDDDVVVEQQPNQNQNASIPDNSSNQMATLENEGGDTVYMEVWPEEGTDTTASSVTGTPGTSQDLSQEFVEEHEGLEQWSADMSGMVADQAGTEQQMGTSGNKRRSLTRARTGSVKPTPATTASTPASTPATTTPSTPASTPKTPQQGLRKRSKIPGSRMHYCKECHVPYDTIGQLNAHQKESGHDAGSRTCKFCKKVLCSVNRKIMHEKEVHNFNQLLQCDICNHEFKRSEDLGRHRRRHAEKTPHPCDKCGLSFLCKQHLNYHTTEQHGDGTFVSRKGFEYRCDTCSTGFRTLAALSAHTCDASPDAETKDTEMEGLGVVGKIYLCEFCGVLLEDRKAKYKHVMDVHKQDTQTCKLCGFRFKRFEDHMKHMKRHEEKSHDCPACERTFIARSQLDRHMQSGHPDVVTCSVCSACFENRAAMLEHKRVEHPAHIISQCGKLFSHLNSLYRHNSKCAICGPARQRYQTQTQTEDPDPIFVCVCEKKFADQTALFQHVAVCGVCQGEEVEHVEEELDTEQQVSMDVVQYYCQQCKKIFETMEHECTSAQAPTSRDVTQVTFTVLKTT